MSTTLLIIIVMVVFLLGIFSVLVDISGINEQHDKVYEYTAKLRKIIEKAEKKKDCTAEAVSVIALSDDVMQIFGDAYSYQVMHISSDLSQNKASEVKYFTDAIGKAEIETYYRLDKERFQLKCKFYNPFTLFYRGIGFILRYVFGYLIELFDKDFDFEGNAWKTMNLIITLLASVFTIMTFFGYDWSKILSVFNS